MYYMMTQLMSDVYTTNHDINRRDAMKKSVWSTTLSHTIISYSRVLLSVYCTRACIPVLCTPPAESTRAVHDGVRCTVCCTTVQYMCKWWENLHRVAHREYYSSSVYYYDYTNLHTTRSLFFCVFSVNGVQQSVHSTVYSRYKKQARERVLEAEFLAITRTPPTYSMQGSRHLKGFISHHYINI